VRVPLFPEDTTHVVLSAEMASVTYQNVIKIIRVVSKEVTVLYFGAHLKGPISGGVLFMKSSIFWDMMQCSPLKANQRFGGTCRLHLQG
jgi:hypothetical protein